MRADIAKFEAFHALHKGFFVIPDSSDILGTIITAHAGFKAISTTSVGLGFMLGCPADQAVSKEQMLAVVRDLCRAVSLPVAVDLESGYADDAAGVEGVVAEVIEAGAVGVALEDSAGMPGQGLRPAEEHAERIRAARRAADKAKLPLFVTGRTDGFWNVDTIPEAEKTAEAIRRANLYLKAGADGIFISGVKTLQANVVAALIKGVDGVFNTLYGPGGPSIAELRQMGVRRLHLGSLPTRAQTGYLKQALDRLRDSDDTALLDQFAMPTKAISELVRPFWRE